MINQKQVYANVRQQSGRVHGIEYENFPDLHVEAVQSCNRYICWKCNTSAGNVNSRSTLLSIVLLVPDYFFVLYAVTMEQYRPIVNGVGEIRNRARRTLRDGSGKQQYQGKL